MAVLRRLVKLIDTGTEWLGRAASWLSALLVLVVSYDVISRYVFNASKVWVQELQWHIFALIFLLGAAWTLKHNRHVRVDLVYQRLSTKAQAWVNLLGFTVFLLPFCLLIIITGYHSTAFSWANHEASGNPGGLPMRYLLRGMIPLAFIWLMIQGFAEAARSLLILCGDTAAAQAAGAPESLPPKPEGRP
jgi:TRAP-type mannitol/chloroaromatic compound transport system permease small subunit